MPASVPVAEATARHPDRALIETLNARRRERFRQAKREGRHGDYVVFPQQQQQQQQQQARQPTTELVNGTRKPVVGTAPAVLQAAHHAVEGDDSAVGMLLDNGTEGGPSMKGGARVSPQDKAQQYRSAHVLVRLLALGFIVPLCELDEQGLSPNIDHESYSVLDAIAFIRQFLREQPGILNHSFHARPHDVHQRPSTLETTTFDVWLLPRVLSAAAVVNTRIAGLLPCSPNAIETRQALLNLAFDVLDISIAKCGHKARARQVLIESLRVSLRALSGMGRPSFLSSAPPPLWLAPTSSEGADEMAAEFFGEPSDETCAIFRNEKQSGDGIARLWLMEDHSSFRLHLGASANGHCRNASSETLFLSTVNLCLRLGGRYEDTFGDLAAMVCELLYSNWQCALRLDPRLFTVSKDYADTITTLRVLAAGDGLCPILRDRLSVLVVQQIVQEVGFSESLPPSPLVSALQYALRRLRSARLKSQSLCEEALMVLKSASSLLVDRCTSLSAVPTTSGLPRPVDDLARQDVGMHLADLASDALLTLLDDSATDVNHTLGEESRAQLVEAMRLYDTDAETPNLDQCPEWLSTEKWARFSGLMFGPNVVHSKESMLEGERRDLTVEDETVMSQQTVETLCDGTSIAGTDSSRQADILRYYFCADAGTLYGSPKKFRCGVCDAISPDLDDVMASSKPIEKSQRFHKWRLDVLIDLILASQRKSASKQVRLEEIIYRALNHRSEKIDSLASQNVARFAAIGLAMSKRSDRIVCGEAIAQMIEWLYEVSVFKGRETLLAGEVSKMFLAINAILHGSRLKYKETALLALSALAKLKPHEIRQRALLALVLQLSADTFSKSLSFSIITQLASALRCTTFQLLSPFLDVIAVEVVERMSHSPILFLEVIELTKQNQSKFLQTTLQYTLPRLLQNNDNKTLDLVAKGVGSDVQTLCFSNAAAVLKHLLMLLPASKRDRSIHIFINAVRGEATPDINVKSLIKAYSVELLGHLVSHLGSDHHHKAASEGLHYMNIVLNERQRTNKSVASRDLALSAFLKDEVLAVLSWYNEELMDVHGKRSITQKSMVTRSIGLLIQLIGEKISNVTPQLMATFNTTMQRRELMLPTLESWLALIGTLRYDDLGPCVGPTVATLLAFWCHFGDLEKSTANAILTHIIVDSPGELRPYLERDLPRLDAIKEDIPEVWQKVMSTRYLSKRTPEQRLKNIVARAATENPSMCFQALTELKGFVKVERHYIESITSGNAFEAIATRTISILLQTAARDDDEIRDLSLQILGTIGAIDPDRMVAVTDDSGRYLLHDFNDKEALTDFSVHLIRSILVGAFKATNDTKHQAALAFAIQELLKIAGFSAALLPAREGQISRNSVVNLRTRQRWNSLVQYIDVLAPLLESKYSVQHGDPSLREKPFYTHASSFKDWIQTWTTDLILGAPGDMANDIFSVFRSVIRDHDLSIAQYLLPHLVVDIITQGTEEQYWEVHGEIVAVLEDQVQNSTNFDNERRLMSAQVVFGVLDHLSVWQRSRRRDRQKAVRHKRDPADMALGQVDKLMQAISHDLMAKASLKCRAYARSLSNFEQQIRKLQKEEVPDEQLQQCYEDLHLIYANLDEPDGMEGVSTLVLRPSLDHQIREHESTGRWTSAQSCWEVKIQEKPDELELHFGLLRCLRNLGHFDTMRTHIRGVVAMHPAWNESFNAFYIEGSCILSDWAEVRRALPVFQQSHDLTPQHATAKVMLAMHDGDLPAFKHSISEARALLGKPLVAARKGGYIGVYDSVAQLHMLHELELVASVHGIVDDEAHVINMEELSHRLVSRLDSTLPSFRTREPMLSLRRSAFNTRVDPRFRDITAQSWIISSKIARRAGHSQTAYSAALQAAQWKAPLAIVQHAKLLAGEDQRQAALHELSSSLRLIHTPPKSDAALTHSYANAYLFLARLSEMSGRGRANEIIELYKKCTELDPQSEKMWYHLGHYYDQYTERELKSQSTLLMQHLNVCKNFLRAAIFGTKFFYRTVPRVLTIWLMYGDNEKFLTALRRSKSSSSKPDIDTENILKIYLKINETVYKSIGRIASYQWLAVLPQLVSRVTHKNDVVWKTLRDLICHVLRSYPDQAMWTMIAGSQSKDKERRSRVFDIVGLIKSDTGREHEKAQIPNTIDLMLQIGKEMLYLCDFPLAKDTKQLNTKSDFPQLLNLAQKQSIILPLQSSLQVSMPSNGKAMSSHQVFDENLPKIVDMDHTIEILTSLQRPRKIVINASNGKDYAFLCKPKDDLRKDARLMEFDAMINNLLQSNSESRKRRLYIRTYSVVTLNEECGLIEWVPNTIGLRHILHSLYVPRSIQLYTAQIKADLDLARADPRRAGDIFETKVESKFPCVFHEWFITMFPEPSAWLEARLNYGRTLAVMSMVGHVLGLGDRHGENILFDSMTGDTVHVDLNCLFDKGTTFEIPERVPFRLTHNLVDALGITGCEGVFRRAAEISMGILREHKDSLMSVLEAMVHDPLVEWGIDDRSSKARTGSTMREDPRVVEARKSLDPVRAKLDGNLKRQAFHDPFAPTTNLSTNSLVDALIREATSSTNLGLMCM